MTPPLRPAPPRLDPSLAAMAAAVCALTLSAIAPAVLAQEGPPPTPVRTEPALMQTIALEREVTGELRAAKRSRVAAEEEGRVIEVLFDEGDTVEAGAVLARLDDVLMRHERDAQQQLVAARESVAAQREAQLANAQRELERVARARQSAGVSETELDDAQTLVTLREAELAEARADLLAARAQLTRLSTRIEKMVVRAPFAGAVVMQEAELGEWIDIGGVVCELVSTGPIDAWLDVPERFLAGLDAPGAQIDVRIDAARAELTTQNFTVIPDVDPLARTFKLRVRLDNPDAALRPGMATTASVPTGTSGEMVTVSKDAVLRNEAGAYVYFDAGGSATPAPVDIRFAVGNSYAVHAPSLPPGAMVIVEGNERLFPSAPVSPINDAATQTTQNADTPAQRDDQHTGAPPSETDAPRTSTTAQPGV